MKLEHQVCNLELAKRLKDLGVKQESLFYWVQNLSSGKIGLITANAPADDHYDNYYSAFTVPELGEMLPPVLNTKRRKYEIFFSYWNNGWFAEYKIPSLETARISKNSWSEADARAKLLIEIIKIDKPKK